MLVWVSLHTFKVGMAVTSLAVLIPPPMLFSSFVGHKHAVQDYTESKAYSKNNTVKNQLEVAVADLGIKKEGFQMQMRAKCVRKF